MRPVTPAPDLGGCGLCWAELCADQQGDARRPSAQAPRPQEAWGTAQSASVPGLSSGHGGWHRVASLGLPAALGGGSSERDSTVEPGNSES